MKKNIILLTIVMGAVFLTGCYSKKDNQQYTEEQEYIYKEDTIVYNVEKEASHSELMGAGEKYFYYYSWLEDNENGEENRVYRQSTDKGSEGEALSIRIDSEVKILRGFFSDEEGNDSLLFLNSETFSPYEDMNVTDFDKNGDLVNRISILDSAVFKENPVSIGKTAYGEYLLVTDSFIRTIGTDGRTDILIPCPASEFLSLAFNTGKMAGVYYGNDRSADTKLLVVNLEKGKIENTLETRFGSACVSFSGSDYYFVSGNALYEYKVLTKEYIQILDFSHRNIGAEKIKYIVKEGDCFSVWGNGNAELTFKNVRYTRTDIDKNEEGYLDSSLFDENGKKYVYICDKTNWLSLEGNNLVDAFNEQSGQYHAVCTEYEFDDAYFEAKMVADGEWPDILIDQTGGITRKLLNMGGLENLYDYFDRDSTIGIDDLSPHVVEQFTQNGILFAVPKKYAVGGILVSDESLMDSASWTIDEFIAWVKDNPNLAGSILCKDDVYDICKTSMVDYFVDYSEAKSHFDNEIFKSIIMEIDSMELPTKEYMTAAKRDFFWKSMGDRDTTIATTVEMSLLSALVSYENEYSRRFYLKAYPTVEGEMFAKLGGQALSILKKGRNKDGAKAFLDFYLSYLSPVEREAYAYAASPMYTVSSHMENCINGTLKADNFYNMFEYEFSENDINPILDMIPYAYVTDYSNQTIVSILDEEIYDFFENHKDIDDVIDVIQSRVQVFLEENY